MSGSETGVLTSHFFAKEDKTKTDKVLDTLIQTKHEHKGEW